MAEKDEQKEVKNVLEQIKSEMMKRKQLRAQNQTNKELDRLSKQLEAQKSAQPMKIPTAQDIVRAISQTSPIFTRDFSAWMKNTLSVAESNHNELSTINSNLLRPVVADRDDTSVEYLDLISDHLKIIGQTTHDGFGEAVGKLELIRVGLGGVSGSIEDSQKNSLVAANRDSRQQTILLLGIDQTISSAMGQVVNQLVRIRDDSNKWNEKNYLAAQQSDKGLSPHPQASSKMPVVPGDQNGDGMPDLGGAGGFLAGAGAMVALSLFKKVLGAPLALIRGLTGIFTGMGGITKMLKGVSKIFRVGPLALIGAAWDFGKGFIDAKEILGKDKVTVVDRIRAGSSELVGGVGDLVDWVTKIFGFDTNFGKAFREEFLALSKKPAEWAQSVVDWFKNDLFAGIDMSTSLTDIPGKLVDNLQAELTKLVNWIGDGVGSLIKSATDSMGEFVTNLKKGFDDKVKKPFYNLVNTILDSIFDIVDKFVSIIPDAIGGDAARKKMDDARAAMKLGDGGTLDNPNVQQTASGQPIAPSSPSLMPVGRDLPIGAATVSPDQGQMLPAPSTDLSRAQTSKSAASLNTRQVRETEAARAVQNNIQQVVDNKKSVTTNNVYNSQSLEPQNKSDMSDMLWGWHQ